MAATRALEDFEIKAIFDAISGRYAERNRTMLICGIAMALRANELCQLNVGDVWGGDETIKTYVLIRPDIAKFNKERTIRLGKQVKGSIAAFVAYKREAGESLATDAPLFVSQMGGYLTRVQFFRFVKRLMTQAGINQSCHALRKTGATKYYIESDYDIIATQQFLGHSNPSTTRRYIGLTTEELELYSEALSRSIFLAILGDFSKGNTTPNMLPFSDNDLLIELQKRGHDVSEILKRQHKRELKASKVVSIDAAKTIS